MKTRMPVPPATSAAQSPLVTLSSLARACGAAREALEQSHPLPVEDHAFYDALRRCGRELGLVAEALGTPFSVERPGVTKIRAKTKSPDLFSAYRAALKTDLPRSVRPILEQQLGRLEELSLARASLTRAA
jgi:hypothetical protein